MNPLIKELASKALKQPDTDNDGLTVFDNDELTKFAELLIKECANIARQTETDDSDDYKSGRTWASLDILEHFGV